MVDEYYVKVDGLNGFLIRCDGIKCETNRLALFNLLRLVSNIWDVTVLLCIQHMCLDDVTKEVLSS